MNKIEIDFFEKVLKLRGNGEIRHRDITTLMALMRWINFEDERDVKNRTIASITYMDKSDVSKSIKRLVETNIIIKNNYGFILNSNLDTDWIY